MSTRILMIGLLLFSFGLNAQKEIVVKGMKLSYEIIDETIEIELNAPTNGWVGVGFNDQNSIVKSDLLLFHVIGNKVKAKDMYVVGFGDPQEDLMMGGTMDVKDLEGKEINNTTQIKFKLPFPSQDSFDFKHRKGKEFWLILAYSTHDEFDHHSRMRQHVLFEFKDE